MRLSVSIVAAAAALLVAADRAPLAVDSLLVPPAWIAEGDLDAARFGWSVASAGDVNGDGNSDVIVGAPLFTNGESGEGRAFLYLGSPTGLATTPAWIAESNQIGAQLGFSVASAGDVNGDGFSDVIVGAPMFDNGQTGEGRAFLYLGSTSGLAASPAWTAEGDQVGSNFGRAVAGAGDVNGDGFSDVVVGADLFDAGALNEGKVFVFLGSAAGLGAAPAWTAHGGQVAANFGHSVATAGDVNGDGFSDLLVGANHYDSGAADAGRAYLFLGSPAGLEALPAWTVENDQPSAQMGYEVASAGDVNGDGFSDVLVSVRLFDDPEIDEGQARLYLGSASGLGPNAAWTDEGNQVGARFGVTLASAGDFNGDGYSDVIVGSDLFDITAADQGRAVIYLGSAAGLSASPSWLVDGDQANDQFASTVAPAGDVDGDGYDDVILGARLYENGQVLEGRAYAFTGSASMPCIAPDGPVFITGVALSVDGQGNPVLSFNDPNAALQRTGYNVYRSSDASLPPASWPRVAEDVAGPQWTDISGDIAPTGVWYYQVTAFNHACPAEGPF